MNIFTIIILLSLADVPTLPEHSRANRRAERSKAIARNRRTAKDLSWAMPWYDHPYHNEAHDKFQRPELEGKYASYHKAQVYDKPQQGRWENPHFGGHRRFAKWERDYYPSGADYLGKLRWEEELREYLDS